MISRPGEGHPLKEGLRPNMMSRLDEVEVSRRGSSTKRGIKTGRQCVGLILQDQPGEGHPLKEGLRLYLG